MKDKDSELIAEAYKELSGSYSDPSGLKTVDKPTGDFQIDKERGSELSDSQKAKIYAAIKPWSTSHDLRTLLAWSKGERILAAVFKAGYSEGHEASRPD